MIFLKNHIKEVSAKEILDSRGNPTLEVKVSTNEFSAKAAVPSGASTGKYEALELKDKDSKNVNTAIKNVNTLIKKLIVGKDVTQQEELDNLMIELDATSNKRKLGANAILGTSLAIARVRALALDKPLYDSIDENRLIPVPFMNIINGGRHAKNNLQFQEFMIVPRFETFEETLKNSKLVFNELQNIITKKYGPTKLGDEGGFAPKISTPEQALDLMQKAVDNLGYEKQIKFAIDVAASEFYKPEIAGQEGHYLFNKKKLAHHKMIEIYEELINNYPVVSIEDPFDQEQFEHFAEFTAQFGKKVQIVGDDLLVTNLERIKQAFQSKSCNALLLKVNQIGTLTESLEAARFALENHWKVMVSHRSGETMDSFISDLAVGLGCGQIKAGAPSKPERLAKYQRLVEIEKELGTKARFADL